MGLVTCIVAGLLLAPLAAAAQHEGHAQPRESGAPEAAAPRGAMAMAAAPLDVPPSREGSGTSWLPDSSPMFMLAWQSGPWELDAMWNVFVQYLDDGGSRGERQLGSVNWAMGMARRSIGAGQLRGRAMLSLEPLTLGRCGHPDLLATGELCRGVPLHDRQHPHDTFMELSAGYAYPIANTVSARPVRGIVRRATDTISTSRPSTRSRVASGSSRIRIGRCRHRRGSCAKRSRGSAVRRERT